MRRAVAIGLVTLIGAASCQVLLGIENPVARGPDAAQTIDAAPGTPDAPPGTPDAPPGTPDATETCALSPCDVLPQCGCGPGKGCFVTDVGAAYCDASGGQAPGTQCTMDTMCPAGTSCEARECRTFCQTTADCATGAPCGLEAGNFKLCGDACDPTSPAQGSCPSGQGCYLAIFTHDGGQHYAGTQVCAPAGTMPVNSTCSSGNDCVGGTLCGDIGLGTKCYKVCSQIGAICPTGGTCSDIGIMLDAMKYGICV